MSSATPSPAGPVVVVTGPTASGKSALAIEIARRFGGEIVNADSMQVYRYMDIGTAKPSLEQRAAVPHHLFDIVTPDQPYSAGRYAREAREVAAQLQARGKLPVITGGTGLYIRAFLDGLIDTGPPGRELRERLEGEHERDVERGEPHRLYARLEELDPAAAARIHPNDARRTIRALEIAESVGQRASQVRAGHAFADRRFPSLYLAVDPGADVVRERVGQRCQDMIDAGLLSEVRGLRSRGYGAELRPMQAIGYRHINPVVDGLDTLANAVVAMQRDTRQYARRQRTWIRAVAEALWMDPREPDAIYAQVEGFLESVG